MCQRSTTVTSFITAGLEISFTPSQTAPRLLNALPNAIAYTPTPFSTGDAAFVSVRREMGKLRCLLGLSLQRLLPIALYHNHGEETADDGSEEDDENDGYTDGPNAWREERVNGVVLIHEWLIQVVRSFFLLWRAIQSEIIP